MDIKTLCNFQPFLTRIGLDYEFYSSPPKGRKNDPETPLSHGRNKRCLGISEAAFQKSTAEEERVTDNNYSSRNNETGVKKRILLIDDDPLVLKSFTKLLQKEGYEVIPTVSCNEAMSAIDEQEFDLVLSDIRMPGRNGVETVSEIQSKLVSAGKKDLPIIFITGYVEDPHKLHAEFLGETLYKPVDNQKLLQTIREYL